MLVTFKSSAYANITMFGDVAGQMLDMMGFGRQVPGAIRVEDVSQALQNLQQGLAAIADHLQAAGDEDEDQPSTSLQTRAVPLLELLQATIADETRGRWE